MEADEARIKPSLHVVGSELDSLSLAELEARIGTLRAEIERIGKAIAHKKASLSAADAVFKI